MSESPNNSPTDAERETAEPAPSRFPSGCLAAILFSPVAYLLSPAPVAWLIHSVVGRDHSIWEIFRLIYAPIAWLFLHSETAQAFYKWYFSLFGLDA